MSEVFAPLHATNPPMSVAQFRANLGSAVTRNKVMPFWMLGAAALGLIALTTIVVLHNSNLSPVEMSRPRQVSHASEMTNLAAPTISTVATRERARVHSYPADKALKRVAFLKRDVVTADDIIMPPSTNKQDVAQTAIVTPNAVDKVQSAGADSVTTRVQTEAAISISAERVSHSHTLPSPERERLYGAIQSGVIMGAINSFGGGLSMTASHDWMQATFRYTSTFGLSSKELFAQQIGKTGSQDVREYALMVGARIEQGEFWASIEAGANVIHASFNTYYAFPKADTLSNDIGGSWGGSAQASFGYKLSDYVGLNFTGFVSNHSITYGGILFSLVVGEL